MSKSLNVALIVPRTEAEGPGHRFALWVQGCHFRCSGCCNPHMLPFTPAAVTPVEEVLAQFLATDTEGLSLLGGEPFEQAEGLAELAKGAKRAGRSVMVFTGYTLEELEAKCDPSTQELLDHVDLLVDGRYDASQRTLSRRWIGSDNQRMHFLTAHYNPLDARFHDGNHLEIHMRNGQITVNGWPVHGARTRVALPLHKG